jgi:NADPH2:quinone reductase
VIPLRDETTLEQGVALFVNPLSALCMIERIKTLNAKAVIITAAASQLGRMLIKLAVKEGITPICVVRRQEQVDLLKGELKAEYVVNSSDDNYKAQMSEICGNLKPTTCLECISGSIVGEMLTYLSFGSTLILYGSLSGEPASNISPLMMLGKNQTIEAFLLTHYLPTMAPETIMQFYAMSE